MQAFEPFELEKLSIIKLPVRKVQVHGYSEDRELRSAERFALVTSLSVICLIMLVLVVIATVTL